MCIRDRLSKEALETVPDAIYNVLNWLDLLADALSRHRRTPEYQTALRKSGVTHGQSGLTATEHETRTATRKAKFDLQTAKKLANQYNDGTLTYQKLATLASKPPRCLLGWFAAATPGGSHSPRQCRSQMQNTECAVHTLAMLQSMLMELLHSIINRQVGTHRSSISTSRRAWSSSVLLQSKPCASELCQCALDRRQLCRRALLHKKKLMWMLTSPV